MNFAFLDSLSGMGTFQNYCSEAENFALTHFDISITAARKAMEYMVKLLYGSAINTSIAGLTTYDMLSDYDFIRYINDRDLLDAFHLIRKKGNQAVHQGNMTAQDAMLVLEKLHHLAGEAAVFLGLINAYPAFDAALIGKTEKQESVAGVVDEQEPDVEAALIQHFTGRLRSVEFFTLLRSPEKTIVEQFINPIEMGAAKRERAQKGTDLAINSRIAFGDIARWFFDRLGGENVLMDNGQQKIMFMHEGKQIAVSVKTGCSRLAVKSAKGEWAYLPGVDFVLYTPKVTAEQPILEQFKVFSPKEFVDMWAELDLIRPKVSSGVAKKLKQILGPDVKIEVEKYADELSVQSFAGLHRRKKVRMKEILDSLPALERGGFEKITAKE